MGETLQHQFIVAGDPHEFDPEKWTCDPKELPKRHPETNISVLIVGAGFGGLMTALECWRKDYKVVGILERSQGPNYSGMFSFSHCISLSLYDWFHFNA